MLEKIKVMSTSKNKIRTAIPFQTKRRTDRDTTRVATLLEVYICPLSQYDIFKKFAIIDSIFQHKKDLFP